MGRAWARERSDRDLLLVGGLLCAGLVLRLLWLLNRGIGHAGGEAENVALAFARGEGVADVFARGSGATAHLNPVMPSFAGAVYARLGPQSTPSEIVLATVALGCSLGAMLVFFRAARIAGVGRWAGLAAIAAVSLLPLNFNDEAVTYRVWEGALATLVGACCLLMTVQADRGRSLAQRAPVLLFFTAALLFWINPALGIAAYLNLLVLFVRAELRPFAFLSRGAVAFGMLVLVLAPWTVRNAVVIGEPILLRSNAGLELALANHPAAAAAGSQHLVFLNRLREMHPLESQVAFDRMRRSGGEVAYARKLGREAQGWIEAHPFDFFRLCLRHVTQFYFPPQWQWSIYGFPAKGVAVRQAFSWALGLLGLIGAGFALIRLRGRMTYLAIVALAPSLPYMIVQPVPRYRYIVLLPLLFLATETVGRMLGRLSQRPRDQQWAEAAKSA